MTKNNIEYCKSLIDKCSDGSTIEIRLKIIEDKNKLLINIIFSPTIELECPLVLHWGISSSSNSSWTQPTSCLFSSNGATPEKCEDGISCESILSPLKDGINLSCEISLNISHLKYSHRKTKHETATNGLENCENIINWLNYENRDWGIKFLFYLNISTNSNFGSKSQIKNWIRSANKNLDFFIPIGEELFLLEWLDEIFMRDCLYRKYMENEYKLRGPHNSKCCLLTQESRNNESGLYHTFYRTNYKKTNSFVYLASGKNIDILSKPGLFTIMIFTDIVNMDSEFSKVDTKLLNEYDITLHFGLTKSLDNIFWNSPYNLLKKLNCDSSIINVNNQASEITFKIDDKYSKCVLQFPEELLCMFKGLVFVIKVCSKNDNANSIKWIKSANNSDFVYKFPSLVNNFDIKGSILNLNFNGDHKIWKNKLREFLEEKDIYKHKIMDKYSVSNESVIANKICQLSQEMGFIYLISLNVNSNCILVLRTISKEMLILHWGLLNSSMNGRKVGWRCPPSSCHPANSTKITDKALETELLIKEKTSDLIFEQYLEITIDKETLELYNRFVCVLRGEDIYGNVNWYKDGDRDIEVSISVSETDLNRKWKGPWSDIIEIIIIAEVDWSSITLMHRYNLMDSIIQRWYREFKESKYSQISNYYQVIWSNRFKEETETYNFNSELIIPDDSIENLNFDVEEFWSWIMIWMRFNALGVLDWQRNYNTAPRLLAHSAENASFSVVSKWVEFPEYRSQIRLILQTVIRGGSRGQEVRDRILHIMHKNGIPEQHGTFYEQWHQKLHNNTTPDDVGICRSIIGYLRSGGNEEVFTKILLENGLSYEKISSYDRPITEKPFLPMNVDINKLICDFEQYLEVLIDVHEALNLQRSLHYSRQYMDMELQNICASIVFGDCKKFDDTKDLAVLHSRLMKINNARERILNSIYYSHGGCNKDKYNKYAIKELLFLDLGLENLQGMFVQSMCTIRDNQNYINSLVRELSSFLSILFGHNPTNKELAAICFDWEGFIRNPSNLNNVLLLRSILERVNIFIGNYLDKTYKDWDPKVVFFSKNIGLRNEDPIIKNFMDEILRSTLFSTISFQIKRISNYLLRNTPSNKLQDWQFISYNSSWKSDQKYIGIVKKVNRVTDINEDEYPKIIICSYISGEEDIPMNVTGIILTNPDYSPDILSHLSVRARNMSVLFVVCQNPAILTNIDKLSTDDICEIQITSDLRINIHKKNIKKEELLLTKSVFQTNVKQKSRLFEFKNKIKINSSWVLYPNEMDEDNVGKKAINLVKLKTILCSESKPQFFVPNCVSLPFGTLQKLLTGSINDRINKNMKFLEETDLNRDEISLLLNSICNIIENELEPSTHLIDDINKAIKRLENDSNNFALTNSENQSNKEDLVSMRNSKINKLIWKQIKKVWCSVYQPLAYNNMKKIGQSLSNVFMSIVIQKLIDAKYAFVLHSKNPIKSQNNPECDKEDTNYDEMYGEIVIGLGETLVSNSCGKSLGFTSKRVKNNKNYREDQFIVSYDIISLPSKSICVFDSFKSTKNYKEFELSGITNNYIFRSDSNAEDIEGFAGAGVFQSIPLFKPSSRYLTYLDQPIINNENYRVEIIKLLATIAFYIQDEYNGISQDIEGCIVENINSSTNKIDFSVAIVQSRPQV
ncbi:R1 like alpha-glucan water dikinase [Cryptosporidium ryanae]|uniref:R1 like alpha-glucan water dikinase n=1 Tax=Cryptosporidium ryanae TaxID=515981 RepID=UPI00351A02CA|nr:R1 like alpha-glucan water dikinase [Cryptosporidium ryanae]